MLRLGLGLGEEKSDMSKSGRNVVTLGKLTFGRLIISSDYFSSTTKSVSF